MKFGMGQPVRRKEDVRLVSGKGRYVDDIQLENTAFAYFVRSPHAHAILRGIDISAARDARGVLGVITASDLPETGYVPVRGPFKNRDGSAIRHSPKMLLPTDKVRFAGEAVAVVVAESPALAKDAAELVNVEYEPLGAAGTLDTAPDAPPVWDDAPGNLVFDWADGDAAACDAAFAKAAKTVSIEVVQNRVAPSPMEPRGAIALYDSAVDRYTLYTSSQGSSGIRDKLAVSMLRIPAEKLRVITQDVGGGFGLKNSAAIEQAVILIAAKTHGRPIKWIGERMEAFLGDGHGRDVKMKGELALDANGRILALRLDSIANMGAYMTHVGPHIPTSGLRVMGGVYRVPIVHARVRGYFTNTSTVTSYRGAGRPEAIYVTERLMDQAARAFGMDALEIRHRNLIRPEELPYRNWKGLSIDSGDFATNLDEAARRADWNGFAERRRASEARGKKRGRGVSYYFEASGGPPGPEPGKIHFPDNGAVEVYLATQSNGQGHETTFAQLICERFGVPFESVIIKQGDTDDGLSGGGTVGSRSLQASGNAMALAMESVIKKGKAAAGQVLQASGAEVEFEVAEGTGEFFVVGTQRKIGITELALTLKREKIPGFESGLDEQASFESPPTFPNGCHICEVEVDPETGIVTFDNYVIVDDVGRVINPLIVDGQVHGGVAQGIGQALLEDCVYDPDTGQLTTATFMDYGMPRADNMPDLDISYNEVPCLTNPLGAKGAGEAGTIGALPAVIGAISDALGIAHIDMPALPEKVWRAANAA